MNVRSIGIIMADISVVGIGNIIMQDEGFGEREIYILAKGYFFAKRRNIYE